MGGKFRALLRMGVRNVVRNRRRTGLSAVAIGLSVAFVWISAALTVGMLDRTVANATQGLLGHVQIHREGYVGDPRLGETLPESLVSRVESVADEQGIELVVAPRSFAQGYAGAGRLGSGVMLLGIDPVREAAASGLDEKLVEGRRLGGADEVLVGDELARRLQLGVGDELELRVSTLAGAPAVGRFVVGGLVATGVVELDQSALFMQLERAQALTGLEGRVHELGLRGADAGEAELLAARIREPVVAAEPGAVVESWREVAPDIAMWVDVASGTFEMFAFVLVLVVGAAILLSQSMAVFERRVELGLLRAIGLRPRQLLLLLVVESSLVGGLGALIGLALGGGALAVMLRTGLDLGGGAELEMSGVSISPVVFPTVDATIPIEAFVTTVVLAALASLLAGARTAARGPMGVIRDG